MPERHTPSESDILPISRGLTKEGDEIVTYQDHEAWPPPPDRFPTEESLHYAIEQGDRIEASERGRLEAEKLLTVDQLTGLMNMRGFTQALERIAGELEREVRDDRDAGRAADQDRAVAIVMLDLDKFKPVNDTLGHAQGDVLLTVVGASLRQGRRPGDVEARLAGDEFALALPHTSDPTEVIRRVNESLPANPISGERLQYNDPVVAIYRPGEGRSIQEAFHDVWSVDKQPKPPRESQPLTV